MREHDYATAARRRRRRFDDDEPTLSRRSGPAPQLSTEPDLPDTGDRWSTWELPAAGERGPRPYPDWVITELAAVDTELGVLKTGKEADVHLVRRGVPDTDRWCLLAAKRYRDSQHRQFHRDAGYLEGRRVRDSRVTRAVAGRTAFGRQAIAGQWAGAEFAVLCRIWEICEAFGVPPFVPYPVQLLDTEIMLEFIGSADGLAAPRLAQLRPNPDELADLWRQLRDALEVFARAGLAHGDLSPYNLLVHDGRLVVIDLPQVVDVVANPQGPRLLARDVAVVVKWFAARGLPDVDAGELTRSLLVDAGVR